MKILFFLFLPVFCVAQQDFDYKLYTRHSECPVILSADDTTMEELTIERHIIKDGIHLSIIPCNSTGNALEYEMEYQGNHFGKTPQHSGLMAEAYMMSFEYVTHDLKYSISIWPTIPVVEIHELSTGKLLGRYY